MSGLDFNARATLGDRFVGLIDDAIAKEIKQEKRREYLGASLIGETCGRRLQYHFLGTPEDSELDPRVKRIFRRGHEGEEWMIEWIRAAGFDLKTAKDGRQFGFEDCEGRFKGHIDGVIVGGPDGFKYPALWECKVLGAKGFNQVKRHGVTKSYPKYAAQVATYQAYMKLAENPAFFTVLNADTMDIHLELIAFNAQLAQECADRAAMVLTACDHGEQLPRASDDPDSFVCRWCPFRGRCHDT